MAVKPKEKILILSGDLGEGHKQAAKAIQEVILHTSGNYESMVIDYMAFTHPHMHVFNKYVYVQTIKKFPRLYGYLFRKTRVGGSFHAELLRHLKTFRLARLHKLLNEVQPTVVISTFPPAAAAMSAIKSKGMSHVPTVTLITDHTNHSYWIHPLTNRYLVGSWPVRAALLELGIPDQQISVTGIPVRTNFCSNANRIALKDKYGLSEKVPTIMIMGGSYGFIRSSLVRLLLDQTAGIQVQFIWICGHNHKLKAHLNRLKQLGTHPMIVCGYTEEVHEYMACADLLITKPGGLTTSEAIASELPMLLYNPLPGQEQDNAKFLLEAGVAIIAKDDLAFIDALKHIIQQPDSLLRMKENASTFQLKQAALRVLDCIIHVNTPIRLEWEYASQKTELTLGSPSDIAERELSCTRI